MSPKSRIRADTIKGATVDQPIRKVEVVSDGILVAFSGGTQCYFPADFLLSQVGVGSNQVFLTYDQALLPSLNATSGETANHSSLS